MEVWVPSNLTFYYFEEFRCVQKSKTYEQYLNLRKLFLNNSESILYSKTGFLAFKEKKYTFESFHLWSCMNFEFWSIKTENVKLKVINFKSELQKSPETVL